MFPIHLEARRTAQGSLLAHDAGLLAAQVGMGATECTYANCALGITLTPEQRIAVQAQVGTDNKSYRVENLADRGFFTSDNMPAMTRLQQLHDAWYFGGGTKAKEAFLTYARELAQ